MSVLWGNYYLDRAPFHQDFTPLLHPSPDDGSRFRHAGTIAWGCLILFGAPEDGADTVRQFVVAIGAAIAVVTMALYLCTACTDPGIVFRHMARPAAATAPGHQQHRSGSAVEVRGVWGYGADSRRGMTGLLMYDTFVNLCVDLSYFFVTHLVFLTLLPTVWPT